MQPAKLYVWTKTSTEIVDKQCCAREKLENIKSWNQVLDAEH